MNKTQINKVIIINKLLIKQFGILKRNKKLPDPVEMTIGTILSQNTNDKNSYKAYSNLKNKFKTWNAIKDASLPAIEKEIRIAGLGKQKSAAIKNFLTSLQKENGKISLENIKDINNLSAIKKLTSYKGIGVKTASCVLLFSLDRDVCPVDTHLFRTINRLGVVSAANRDKTFYMLNENFPPKIAHSFHTNLIRLGREICTPKNPSCGICPLLNICQFEEKLFSNKKPADKKNFMLLDNIRTSVK